MTKLDEDDTGEAHSAAEEAWHWPKPSSMVELGPAHRAGLDEFCTSFTVLHLC